MAQSVSNTSKNEKAANRPIHVIRYGTIRATVWRNVVDGGDASRTMYNVTLSRSYKDKKNNWKESGSFGPDDLLRLAKAIDHAHTWINQQQCANMGEAN